MGVMVLRDFRRFVKFPDFSDPVKKSTEVELEGSR
jgi:hypothetical protein